MVYYSPYKQIWRAFICAVRTFISSLFSKRLLFMIIVALVVMLLHLNVHAESIYQDGYAYRQITNNGYDEESDSYSYSFRIYNSLGLNEGDFSIPSSLYNMQNWFISYLDGFLRLYRYTGNVQNANFYIHNSNGTRYTSWNSIRTSISDCQYCDYNLQSKTWGSLKSYGNSYANHTSFEPNSIILTHNVTIYFRENSNYEYDFNTMRDYRVLKTPNLKFYTGTGFRLYLNQFEPFSSSEYEDWDNNYSSDDIVTIYFSIYDLNSKTYMVENNTLELQDYDEEGNLYVDLLFSDMPYMNVLDGDYLLIFGSNLSNKKLMNGMSSSLFKYTTLYQTVDYWRYTYYADSGAGILRAVYEDGTEKPNQDNTSIDEPSQEDTTSQAINELNNTINNQTTIIQEQTNSINDMSDFMQDDSFSSDSITNNMPSSDEFQDVTENGFDNIFTTLRNAFTSDNYQDVEFVVPFSNGQKITIPSNLTENIIPTAIKTLIQMVYWYFIARFIVKDIASYIEKAKSGDIFSSSDTNIKTDML